MKIFRFTLITIAGLLCSIAASAAEFKVDGIYYEITSSEDLTVEVKRNTTTFSSYTGTIVIPEKVVYNEVSYSVTSIGDYAFYECAGLTSITIPNSVTNIGGHAFYGCYRLANITLPNSLTSIESYLFYGCGGLTSITIPNTVTSIGSHAFYSCDDLTSITIGDLVTYIGENAFHGTGWWSNQSDGLVYLDDYLLGYKGENPTGNMNIIEGTKVIAGCAFRYCSNLTSITIPNSVIGIGYHAFADCEKLETVINLSDLTIERVSQVPYFTNVINADELVGDFCFKTEEGVHYLVGYVGTDSEITLPENYKGEKYKIGSSAFWDCSSLTVVVIPNSVTSIGRWAFRGCSSLTSVTIPNSVTSIESLAFDGCSSLTSITIPNTVTNIEYGVFDDCDHLTSIKVENGNTVYESRDGNRAIVRKSDGYVVFSIVRNMTVEFISSTQTTLTFQISYEEDEYFES